ncbi:zinc finger FYVE domain-containing protein 1-like isoform X2 [Brevipalpus obovatus]|uniref:zinc finger FYVE domain-containing protein 1-like isoform X2 n=1 Tax=Brevipalpus obovatus TaxID=246614 RepID=UPI003D9E7948
MESKSKSKDQKKEDMSSSEFKSLPDVAQSSDNVAIMQLDATGSSKNSKWLPSFLLIDGDDKLQIQTSELFCRKLGLPNDSKTPVKVVSIFGKTGEGKSHTLNYTFFGGEDIFKTSPAPDSCTIGIWAAYDPVSKIIAIDTEGLLGISENNDKLNRLLLKVLAVSDIVIYRTRAERLHSDLFTFLGDASQAYVKYFSSELRLASQRCNFSYPLSDMGPVVVVFHETLHNQLLTANGDSKPEDFLRQKFQKTGQSTQAFSALEYVGINTRNPPTSFKNLKSCLQKHLQNSTVRSARHPSVLFSVLKHLNEKFSCEIDKSIPSTFPDEYFTCNVHCLSCGVRCNQSMNHIRDGLSHGTNQNCRYQHQFDNKIYTCSACYANGEPVRVVPKSVASNDPPILGLAKYAWSGYVLECSRCGIIYRSRQYWYGNKDPLETCVKTEVHHVWPGEITKFKGAQNAAQRVLDGVNFLSETVSHLSAKPTQMVRSWVADQIAPSYWVPNSRISQCRICEKKFDPSEKKHHCRACGDGFCEDCSDKTRPVPERGWGETPVRVCKKCFDKAEGTNYASDNKEVTVRKIGEVVQSTLGTVASAIDYPLEWIKENARPDYWVPDKDILKCKVCKTEFSEKLPIHHCRACGNGVCDGCSPDRKPVPNRGWDHPVRVCRECLSKES